MRGMRARCARAAQHVHSLELGREAMRRHTRLRRRKSAESVLQEVQVVLQELARRHVAVGPQALELRMGRAGKMPPHRRLAPCRPTTEAAGDHRAQFVGPWRHGLLQPLVHAFVLPPPCCGRHARCCLLRVALGELQVREPLPLRQRVSSMTIRVSERV